LVALDDALDALAQFDPRKANVVEMRFFGGLSAEETAEVRTFHRKPCGGIGNWLERG
jgi:DNA-directed RNA polymerase specialized sigma24 family protein